MTKQSTFEEENARAKEEFKGSYLPHVAAGAVKCTACPARYYADPPDNKCPACGGKITWLRSARKQAALISIPELTDPRPGGVPQPDVLALLRQAKQRSDRGDYAGKHSVLSRLIRQTPADFLVDQPGVHHPGVTHTPTGFRFHLPAGLAGLIPPPKLATHRFVPADANDPADREDCPHCHTMHERDNGRCNRCGELWPAKSK